MASPYEVGDRVEVYTSTLAGDLASLGLGVIGGSRGRWLRGTVRDTSRIGGTACVRVVRDAHSDTPISSLFRLSEVRPIAAVDLLGELAGG